MIGGKNFYTLSDHIIFTRITHEDKEKVRELKKINSIIFPQAYNDIFYRKLLSIARFYLVYTFDNQLIGTLSFLLIDHSTLLDSHLKSLVLAPSGNCCYIMNLGVISVYRKKGFGTHLWGFIRKNAEEYFGDRKFEYALHVQVKNTSAIKFYEKLGFERIGIAKDYYRGLESLDALVMARNG